MNKDLSGIEANRLGVIFDLDLTLIDSSSAAALRRARQWGDVYPLIPMFRVYPGIPELLSGIAGRGIPTAIVTTSPRPYCERVLSHHRLKVAHATCYHDTQRHKPDPAPILHAVEWLGVPAHRVISVGDDPNDIIASRQAGVVAVAATWGCLDPQALLNARPDHVVASVDELRQLLGRSADS